MSDSYTSSSYYYSSTTSTTDGTTTTGHRYTTTSHTDPDGNTIVRTAHQDLGQPAIIEERHYDRTGQEQRLLEGPGTTSSGGTRRITDITDETETGSTTYDAGSAYGGPIPGAREGEGQGTGQRYDESIDRVTYDTGPPYGLRSFNEMTGAYDEAVEYDADGVERGRGPRYEARSGYTSLGRGMREYEDPSTGARIRRQSDIDVSDVLG